MQTQSNGSFFTTNHPLAAIKYKTTGFGIEKDLESDDRTSERIKRFIRCNHQNPNALAKDPRRTSLGKRFVLTTS